MKKILIIVFSIILTGVYAQDYKELIKNVQGADKYPDASAINVYTQIDISLNADGSYQKHVYYIKKILTYKGKHRYSDVKLDYNANFETIDLGECFSVRGDEKIDIPKEAIHDNGTFLTMYSPEYINQRQKVVNFPAIEPNDFIVVNYTINSKSPAMFFSGIEQMQEANPYIEKHFTVTADKNVKLNYKFDDKKIDFSKKEDGNKIVYSWNVKDVPLIKDEKNKPSYSIIGRPVFYSIESNWADASDILFKQFNSVDYKAVADIDFVKKLKNSKESDDAKIKALYSYIQDNYVFKYSLKDDGFKPQELSKVLKQQFGSANELTALFIAMANSLGINVEPVVVLRTMDGLNAVKEVPCTDFIRGIYAFHNGTLISLRNQYLPYGTTWNEKAYIIHNDKSHSISDYTFDTKGLITRNIDIKLNTDNTADVNFQKTLKGGEDFMIRRQFKNETEKKRKIWFTSNISDKSINVTNGPEFINMSDYTQNLKINFSAKIDNYFVNQDNYMYFKLPEPEKVDLTMTGNSRETPYQIDNTYSITETYVFENVPNGYKVIKPKTEINKTYKTDKVEMSFKIKSENKDGKIVITREIIIPQTIVSVKDYPEFYNFISDIQKPLNNMVFLAK